MGCIREVQHGWFWNKRIRSRASDRENCAQTLTVATVSYNVRIQIHCMSMQAVSDDRHCNLRGYLVIFRDHFRTKVCMNYAEYEPLAR